MTSFRSICPFVFHKPAKGLPASANRNHFQHVELWLVANGCLNVQKKKKKKIETYIRTVF